MQANDSNLDINSWISAPPEAQGGHQVVANCLAEIKRHSNDSYVVPLTFLSSSVGAPLLPLMITSRVFARVRRKVEGNPQDSAILNRWYSLDGQSTYYRLNTTNNNNLTPEKSKVELSTLLNVLVHSCSKDWTRTCITTVLEQEMGNTVFKHPELLQRLIWIRDGERLPEVTSTMQRFEANMVFRSIHTVNKLKYNKSRTVVCSLHSRNPNYVLLLKCALDEAIDTIIKRHSGKRSISPVIDRRLFEEIGEVNRHSRILNLSRANFSVMDRVQSYLTSSSRKPLVIIGRTGAGKSTLMAKISQNIYSWLPEGIVLLRYANLTAMSSDVTSLVGSITDQLSVLVEGVSIKCHHTIESYRKKLRLLKKAQQQIIILIDSIDSLRDVNDLKWLPSDLLENEKLVLTVTSNSISEDLTQPGAEDPILKNLKEKIGDADNFLRLTPFTQEQWKKLLCLESLPHLVVKIPESWKNCNEDESILIKAKILRWLAWLGVTDLTNTSVTTISEQVFEVLEKLFSSHAVSFIISLLLAAREGLQETELVMLIRDRSLAEECPTKVWAQFCWTMGPLLLHNQCIVIMDKTLREVAERRYKQAKRDAHGILYKYFEAQPDSYGPESSSRLNTRKLVELPYHQYKLMDNDEVFAGSSFLTDLKWLQMKLNATGCVHLLNDVCLVNLTDGNSNPALSHLVLLKEFLGIFYKDLNDNGSQLNPLLYMFLDEKCREFQWEDNDTPIRWKNIIDSRESAKSEIAVDNGYDLIMPIGAQGIFLISMSTRRGEICVWDVANKSKIRTITGIIPNPTAVYPVGDCRVAVLCGQQIKILDLDEGEYKITLDGVHFQKKPFLGLYDPSHLVCLSRGVDGMYVKLMNIESGECVARFKTRTNRLLNPLLVSGDGRILVSGDAVNSFQLNVWNLSQKELLCDLRMDQHFFTTPFSAITHEGYFVCIVVRKSAEVHPNTILVYDVQQGTLYAKVEVSCNIVSLAISRYNSNMIIGIGDSTIALWDLITSGWCGRLVGHNAPTTMLKLDPTGKYLLSGDKGSSNLFLCLWDLVSCDLVEDFAPPSNITAAEVLNSGLHLAITLKGHSRPLIIVNIEAVEKRSTGNQVETACFGYTNNHGRVFRAREVNRVELDV